MRYYRDLEPDEPLQAGDEILADPPQWVPVNPSLFGLSPAARSLPEYRRPVDLPVLQRVTPEAMAELERCDECEVILFLGIGAVLRMSWKRKIGWLAGSGMISARPSSGWFIELATISEVT